MTSEYKGVACLVMSKYSDKIQRRRTANAPIEPQDDYSIIQSYALRQYFRARAGMYGLTQGSYRQLKVELSSFLYGALLRGGFKKFTVPITSITAVSLGEMFRDRRARKSINMSVFSVPFGGRMRIKVLRVEECHSIAVAIPELTIIASAYVKTGRPLRKDWLAGGTVAQMARI